MLTKKKKKIFNGYYLSLEEKALKELQQTLFKVHKYIHIYIYI